MLSFGEPPPLSLYVHLPWCIKKCPYCDFNSYEIRGDLPDEPYVTALLRDLQSEVSLVAGRVIESVFLGGGTPSLVSAAAIKRLLEGIRAIVPLASDAEITLEANPGAVDEARFAAFRAAGVTRLSIGVQSFRDAKLAALGRVHDSKRAVEAIEAARAAGFENFNVDLMYALPGDDLRGALEDLETALSFEPPHLSWYQLTFEPNTAFERNPPQVPDEARVLEIEEAGRSLLARSGTERYEISAYAKPGFEARHNLNYWRFGDYLGIGAGAQGKVTVSAARAIERRAKTRNPRTYMDKAGDHRAVTAHRLTSSREVALECLMNGLRLMTGITTATFESRAGQSVERVAVPRREAERLGWLAPETARLRATEEGLKMLNRLLELFV